MEELLTTTNIPKYQNINTTIPFCGLDNINVRNYQIDEINILDKIGTGAYGDVMLGTFRDRPDIPIVVKRFKKYDKNEIDTLTDFFKELILTQYINNNSKYVIRMYGTLLINDHHEDKLYVILEKFGNSIDNTIIKNRKTYNNDQYKIIFTNILKAFSSLHSCGVFHSDIKPANILIDEHLNIKIIDFGLSEYLGIGPTLTIIKDYICTEQYLAPKDRENLRKSYQSDSFSIGQVFYNILLYRYIFLKAVENEDKVILKDSGYTDEDLKIIITGKTNSEFYRVLISLLNPNIKNRLTPREVLELPYFTTGTLHGGALYNNHIGYNNVEYDEDDFKNANYELAYVEQIISLVSKINVNLSPISIDLKNNINNIYSLMIKYEQLNSEHYVLSENNIFNTICTLRNVINDKDTNKYMYPLNFIYSSLDSNYTVNKEYFIKAAKKRLINIYTTSIDTLNTDINNIMKEFILNPQISYYPIWTLIEYFHIIYFYNNNIQIDRSLIFNIIIYFFIGTNEDININLWEICLYIINKKYPPIFNLTQETTTKYSELEDRIKSIPFNIELESLL